MTKVFREAFTDPLLTKTGCLMSYGVGNRRESQHRIINWIEDPHIVKIPEALCPQWEI